MSRESNNILMCFSGMLICFFVVWLISSKTAQTRVTVFEFIHHQESVSVFIELYKYLRDGLVRS